MSQTAASAEIDGPLSPGHPGRVPRPDTPGDLTRRARSMRMLQRARRQRSGGQNSPKSRLNKGLRRLSGRASSCRFGFRGSLGLRRSARCDLRFLGSGPSRRLRKSQEVQNAQLFANWPFPRILAQSPLKKAGPRRVQSNRALLISNRNNPGQCRCGI
jgi:hypothetical protein